MAHATDITREDIYDRLPRVLPREEDSVISRYIAGHAAELDSIDKRNEKAIVARHLGDQEIPLDEKATVDDLDRLGAIFGELGKRRGRDDDEYRAYLGSVVTSFNGRGSRRGLKFAISAAVNGDPGDVTIVEDFDNLEYTINIENVDTSFLSAAVNDLAELADPSAVKLDQVIIVAAPRTINVITTDSSVVETTVGLGGDTLTLDGASKLQ